MNSVSKVVLGAAVAFGSMALLATAPALAQTRGAQAPVTLSKDERAALLALQTAIETKNYPAAAAAVSSAQSAARSGEARYYAAALQLRLGIESNNPAIQASAIDAMIASGAVPAADLPELYKSQGLLALSASRWDRAETSYTRWVEAAPSDPEALISLAEVKDDIKKVPESVALYDRAIELRRASGQAVPESWYKRALKHAFDSKAIAQTAKFSRYLVAAYPSPQNWRDAILVHRDIAALDPAARLDLLRLLRASKSLAGERDYSELATALNGAELPMEAKAVLDEGVAAKMVDPAKAVFKELIATSGRRATADKAKLAGLQTKAMAAATGADALRAGDASLAAGDYAKAADLLRAAIQKGSVDPNAANMKLGIASALAGNRPAAEAALRAVTGPRAEVAALWMVWLTQRS